MSDALISVIVCTVREPRRGGDVMKQTKTTGRRLVGTIPYILATRVPVNKTVGASHLIMSYTESFSKCFLSTA